MSYIFVHLQILFLDKKNLKRSHYKFDMMLDIVRILLRKNLLYSLVHQTLLEYGKIHKLLELLMMYNRYS